MPSEPRKRDYQDEYWGEAVADALYSVGKDTLFSQDEINEIASSMRISAEMQSQAFGWDVADRNFRATQEDEKDSLRKELRRERAKVNCRSCGGYGRLKYYAGPWAVDTECPKCHGEGRHDP